MDTQALSTHYLMYILLPLWLLAGLADWQCHRRSDLAHTTGMRETAVHLLMLAEVGLPLLAALLLEINAGVMLLMVVGFIAHELTALWDVRMATRQRNVSAIEQHIHSFLELIPFMGISMVCLLHWDQARTLITGNWERADFALAAKNPPLSNAYLVAILGATLLFCVLPYLEELLRGYRAGRARGTPGLQ